MDNWMNLSQFGYNAHHRGNDYTAGRGGGGGGGGGASNMGFYSGYSGNATDNPVRGRSQSLSPANNTSWEKSRRQSAPVRWHPQYAQSSQPVHSPSNWTMTSLETIPEDGAGNNRQRNIMNESLSPQMYGHENYRDRRYSHYEMTNYPKVSPGGHQQLYQKRSTSEGELHKVGKDIPKNEPQKSSKGNNNVSNQKENEDKKRRRKSQISFDAGSEKDIRNKISDVRSVQSGRSKVSSKNRLEVHSGSPRETRSASPRGSKSTTSRHAPTTSIHGSRKKSNSSRICDASYLPRNKSSASVTSEGGPGTKVTFAESPLDIPVELLDLRRASWRKVLRPIIVTVLVISLVVSLFVAVYFAAALKESQERQIEFLQATLEFSLSQNQRSRDFSSLTASETRELKSAYCRQVDAWYRGSSLTDEYRGCQLNVITNDRIEFVLFFLDETGPPKGAVEIMSILENRAEQEGQEGKGLVKISDVTLDLSPSRASVDLAVTSKPKDFIGVNSRDQQFQGGDGAKENEGVIVSKSTKRPTTTTVTTTTTTTTTETSQSKNLDDTVLSKDICQSIRLSEVVAHPFSCGHFIQCEFGTPIARPCSGGLVFDPKGSACVKPRTDLPCTEIFPCANVNGGHFAHPTDCRLFVICDRGKSVMLSCPPGLIWDMGSQNCVPRKRGTRCQPAS